MVPKKSAGPVGGIIGLLLLRVKKRLRRSKSSAAREGRPREARAVCFLFCSRVAVGGAMLFFYFVAVSTCRRWWSDVRRDSAGDGTTVSLLSEDGRIPGGVSGDDIEDIQFSLSHSTDPHLGWWIFVFLHLLFFFCCVR